MRKPAGAFAAGLLLSLLAGCGGGGGSGIPGSFLGGGSGSSSSFVRVTQFSVDKNSVSTPGESFTFSFSVDYSSPSGIYMAQLYYNNAPTMPWPEGGFYIANLNCSRSGGLYQCGSSGQFNCSYEGYLSSYPVVRCQGQGKALLYNGDVYFIFRACIYNERVELVCDTAWRVVRIPVQ